MSTHKKHPRRRKIKKCKQGWTEYLLVALLFILMASLSYILNGNQA